MMIDGYVGIIDELLKRYEITSEGYNYVQSNGILSIDEYFVNEACKNSCMSID